MTSASVGRNLRFYRSQRRLTQMGLAEAADISTKQLSDIELGKANPSLDTLNRISAALGVEIGSLVSGEPSVDLLRPTHDLSRFQPAFDRLPETAQDIVLRAIAGMLAHCRDPLPK